MGLPLRGAIERLTNQIVTWTTDGARKNNPLVVIKGA